MIVQALPSWSRPGMLQAPACALLPTAGLVWVDEMWHQFALARLQWASLFFQDVGWQDEFECTGVARRRV